MLKKAKTAYPKNYKDNYSKFQKINGNHPFKESCPESYVEYPARQRKGGKLKVFNFELAKEMGLITEDHPNKLTAKLEKAFLDAFAIVIINEYDELNNIKYPVSEIKPNKYMATRYLQLQHPNKQGLTSGDGRSIWNGTISNNGKTFDITSCGTGATKLSPATSIQNKFFKTGDLSVSYGCGYSEVEEGLATLFFSEIMHKNKVNTERLLGVIEFEKGYSINIRVHENLIRPSHMFNHLKQGNYSELKNVVDYYIDRQVGNGSWKDVPTTKARKYKYFLERQSEVFSKLAANFEDDYIFCWMDWDGDNILMDGSIIDYGSVRQFGLYHNEYRYDDVERFSTSLSEQKSKMKYIVQTFAQITDFLISKEKSQLSNFKTCEALTLFEKEYNKQKIENIIHRIGIKKEYKSYIEKSCTKELKAFMKSFSYFEESKSKKGLEKVEDGINYNAIFCMRDILRELPKIYLSRNEKVTHDEFISMMASSYAMEDDLELTTYRKKKIDSFQKNYWTIVEKVSAEFDKSISDVFLNISMRSSTINRYDRVTGDSISVIVEKISKVRPKIKGEKLYSMLKKLSEYQNLDPDDLFRKKSLTDKSLKSVLEIVRDYREGL